MSLIESVLQSYQQGLNRRISRSSNPSLADHETLLSRNRSLFASRSGSCGGSFDSGRPRSNSLSNMTSTTINDVMAIEHPTLKVPYEILNKKFRLAQKNIDREVSRVKDSAKELEAGVKNSSSEPASSSSSPVTVGAITDLLSGVIDKLTVLKRKAHESINDELDAASNCKKRLDHVKEYYVKTSSPIPATPEAEASVNAWKKKRLDRILVEHLLRCGFYDTAVKLATTSGIESLTNIDLFLVSRRVEESLRKRETSKCLAWCNDNKSKLRKLHSTLEFNLRQQEFIEFIRQGKRMEGVKHVRKFLAPYILESPEAGGQLRELENCMALLAFPPNTQVEPYKSLFDESRWTQLIEQFRQENFKLFQLSSTSVFSVTLQSGLSALKTPQCYRRDGERVADCPVCSELMNSLASSLPCAHASQSRLVCAISGQPLNEHNQPMMLPNGHVYGSLSLRQMADQNKGKIICPRTKKAYEWSECEKVFVM